jgi:NhaA family Na+:H+ antiporter
MARGDSGWLKPAAYSGGSSAARVLAIGSMSLFIAGQAFPVVADFAASKIAVFAASVLSAIIGVAVLWGAPPATDEKAKP